MDSDERLILALDIGGTKVLGGLVTESGRVVHKAKALTGKSVGPDAFLQWLRLFALELLREAGVGLSEVSAVGIAAPGLVDAEAGVMLYGPHTGWRDVPFGPYMATALGLPAAVHNDVNACALGEMAFGAARGIKDFVWVTVSTGIGGAVVVGGRLYLGSAGIAGEFGHLCVVPGGAQCDCGNRGCLEPVASGSAIARRAAALGLPASTAEDVARRARSGDERAAHILAEAGAFLGTGLSMVANILNPGLVVVGGGVSLSLDLLLPSLRASLAEHCIGESNRMVPVVRTGLGYEAGLLGAAAVGLQGALRVGDDTWST